ncbi:uncharacterized protein VTP21DRAFT_912 [Calcarisporiella thermophila]|uniref:uncharacterized protein n=1 Tax=Calcarisporiella thermophila TaxID=911321 RepID=UPI0037438265
MRVVEPAWVQCGEQGPTWKEHASLRVQANLITGRGGKYDFQRKDLRIYGIQNFLRRIRLETGTRKVAETKLSAQAHALPQMAIM